MDTVIRFVRHGETDWNKLGKMQGWKNSNLTSNGKNQARLLGESLKEAGIWIDEIFTSPSLRTIETVKLINPSKKIKITSDKNLQEISMANWEGKTFDEIKKYDEESWNQFWSSPYDFEAKNGGETFFELAQRSNECLNKIISENKGKSILVVSHRITIKSMIAGLLNEKIDLLDDVLSNSLSTVVIRDEKVELTSFSNISHYNY